ncbi:uncharacterized protein F4822DRAFT_428828 [Hypoxylon trugodes]|uniref:uncharacterized protein n=1 Tax=Hypoxylon trugodes TaxID=326681 RepID=UPI0021990FFE|nr:uncharacterized protein F4822DRAFT_428828 [Hypoxylon trugodes]KAI1388206.1 hypothetical protein F4822DRAFT_428828 [Hypoxylon trugodes]
MSFNRDNEMGGAHNGFGFECSPASSKMSAKVERMRDRWGAVKQRTSPIMFPHAWLFFLAIIFIATGAVAAGWYGLAIETIRHQSLSTTSTVSATRQPAQPNLEASAFHITSSDSQSLITTLESATVTTVKTTAMPSYLGSNELMHRGDGNGLETPLAKDYVTTLVITTVVPILQSDSSVSSSPTSTVPTAQPTTVVETEPITVSTTVYTDPTTTVPPTSSIDSTSSESFISTIDESGTMHIPSSIVTITSTSTTTVPASTSLLYCPVASRPNIWTLCSPLGTAVPSAKASSAGVDFGSTNPFTVIRKMLVYVWDAVMDLVFDFLDNVTLYPEDPEPPPIQILTTSQFSKYSCVTSGMCDCEATYKDLLRRVNEAIGLLRIQQYMLGTNRGCLLVEQEKGIKKVMEVLGGEKKKGMENNSNAT